MKYNEAELTEALSGVSDVIATEVDRLIAAGKADQIDEWIRSIMATLGASFGASLRLDGFSAVEACDTIRALKTEFEIAAREEYMRKPKPTKH